MYNRIEGYFAQPPPQDFYVVSVVRDDFIVTAGEAGRVLSDLSGWGPPWVRLTDVFGSTVYVRSEFVSVVRQCAPHEREAALRELEAEAGLEEEDEEDGAEDPADPCGQEE